MIKPSERPMGERGVQYHIGIDRASKYILMAGDPDRVPKIVNFWDISEQLGKHREFISYIGTYKNVPLMAISTGIGGPPTAIAVEELLSLGAEVFIRVGSTGSLWRDIKIGDLVISTGAVRLEGTSKQYVMAEYPAVASYEVVLALIEAAETIGVRYHVGLTASTDSFYVGQGRPGYEGYLPSHAKSLLNDLRSIRILNFEMEAATLFTLANIYGARAGAVCAVYANRESGEFIAGAGEEDAIKVANEAVKILNDWDSLKKRKGAEWFYPGLLDYEKKH